MITEQLLSETEGIDADASANNFVIPYPGSRISFQAEANDKCSFGKISKSDYQAMVEAAGYQKLDAETIDLYCPIGWEGDLNHKGKGGFAFKHVLYAYDHIKFHPFYVKQKNSPNKASSLIYCFLDIANHIKEMSNPAYKNKVFGFWSKTDKKFIFLVKLPGFKNYLLCVLFPEIKKVNGCGFNLCTLYPIPNAKMWYIRSESSRYKPIKFKEGPIAIKKIPPIAEVKKQQPQEHDLNTVDVLGSISPAKAIKITKPEESLLVNLNVKIPADDTTHITVKKKKKNKKKNKSKKPELTAAVEQNVAINKENLKGSYAHVFENLKIDENKHSDIIAFFKEDKELDFVDVSATVLEMAKRLFIESQNEYSYLNLSNDMITEFLEKMEDCFNICRKLADEEITFLHEKISNLKLIVEEGSRLLDEQLSLLNKIINKKLVIDNEIYDKIINYFLKKNNLIITHYPIIQKKSKEMWQLYEESTKLLTHVSKTAEANPGLIRFVPDSKRRFILQATNYHKKVQNYIVNVHSEIKEIDGLIDSSILKLIKLAGNFLKICKIKRIDPQGNRKNMYVKAFELVQFILQNAERYGSYCIEWKSDAVNEFLSAYNALYNTKLAFEISSSNPSMTMK